MLSGQVVKRLITAATAFAIIAVGYEYREGTGEVDVNASTPAAGVERIVASTDSDNVDAVPVADEILSAEDSLQTGGAIPNREMVAPEGTTPALPEVVYSFGRGELAIGKLDGARVDAAFGVRLEMKEATVPSLSHVVWRVDGIVFRDNDLDAPYNLRYFGLLPLNAAFGSDQGLSGIWRFDAGTTHSIEAVAVFDDGSTTVYEATFAIADERVSTVTSSTTTAPSLTTAVPTTAVPSSTTAAPTVPSSSSSTSSSTTTTTY